MGNYLLYLVLGFLGLLVIFWLLNLLMLKIKNYTSIWLSRGVYVCGLLCVLLNIIRVFLTYEVNRGVHITSNIIVLINIIIAFIRWESKSNNNEYEI